MPKVRFLELVKELRENKPDRLIKRLSAEGITVHMGSSLDDETANRIRSIARASAPAAEAAAESESAPVAVAAPPTPEVEEAPAPTSAVPEQRPVTRIIKRVVPGRDGQPTVQRPEGGQPAGAPRPTDEKARKRPNLLITPLGDGGLSPEAEFGIVKAAGTVPMPPPRPERPPQRPDGERPPFGERPPGRTGPPRPEGGRPPRPGMGPAPTTGPAPEAGKTGLKGPGRTTADKKKQKRTVFSEKEKSRLQNRSADVRSGSMRGRRKRRVSGPKGATEQFVIDEPIIITGNITVGDLAERVHVTPAQVITQLIGMGVLATVNQQIEPAQAVSVLEKLGFEALFESELAELASWRLSTSTTGGVTEGEIRPPVVTILGHVDHGKTTLLDSIRKTHVTAQEFGGITQHIGAYQVVVNEKKITFLDTPGHAAFTAMRARGANLTDIAVLVVAADDGIQPQTIEAIDHAKAAHVPIIVAINKIDLPDAQPDVVKQHLTGHELVSEEWGGDTIMVPLSAKKGENIEQLLEMILLVADVQELRAVAEQPAKGAVVESKLDKQRGPVATILIQEGTLHVGDALVVGMVSGKVRAMNDDKGRPLREAGPSTPVEITGLAEVPVAGDLFETVDDERKAREIAEERHNKVREERLQAHVSLQNLSSMVASGLVKDLNLIVKTDVAGSIEAISQAVAQVEHEEIRVNIIHAGVGDVTESDVLLATASQAIIVGFHVHIEPQARLIAEDAGIDVRLYQVIYDLVDDVTKAMIGMLAPVFEEVVLGHAEVRAIFKISRLGTIAGCYVIDGLVRRGTKVRIKRAGEVVQTGNLDSLKHIKEDVREMAQGFECGISLDNYNGWQEGDIIESYIIKELRRETL